ncbi:histidine phosphotransferase family protein [Paracoccus aminophilus]|uniref:Histidine phosphotransferase ChpT C-terminal domain-containing protein n=1 Tax=Paracoccus aminophilus JCM 7686 TaxID=1367847 RepID=S5XWI9_PARAH|nr:histidine phosphotransferase family protein [Paracoccus aminophilus]AGT07780.1 hypothetical protein JCM7686_0671 [Paracoccus aminophilus JCM 7686]
MSAGTICKQAEEGLSEHFAALVGSRLCHDLISPLGAIGNGVELLQLSGEFPGIGQSSELQLISESVDAARNRISLFRMAFGHTSSEQRIGRNELASLLETFDRNGRIRIRFEAEGDLPRTDGRLIMLALMCFETAMPWGGRVLICRAASGWRLVAEATRIKTDPALWAWLDGGKSHALPMLQPPDVHFGLMASFAHEAGRNLMWELDENGGEISF